MVIDDRKTDPRLEELQNRIQKRLRQDYGKAVSPQVLRGFLNLFPQPLGVLADVFVNVTDTPKREKHRIQQDIILELLCKIEAEIRKALENLSKSTTAPVRDPLVIALCDIVAHGEDVESVVGAIIRPDAGPVELKQTRIEADGLRAGKVVALEVGSRKNEEGER